MKIISRKEAKSLGLKYYFTNKPCKHGHISERIVSNGYCNDCSKKQSRRYAKNNSEKVLAMKIAWRAKNKEHTRKYNKSRKELINQWVNENREMVRHHKKNYKRRNPMIVFTRATLERLERHIDAGKYESIFGYSQKDFVKHIESQFKKGMNWKNRSEWHIDHIKPIKAFMNEGITDVRVINALSNLQPLWAKDNLIKGANY